MPQVVLREPMVSGPQIDLDAARMHLQGVCEAAQGATGAPVLPIGIRLQRVDGDIRQLGESIHADVGFTHQVGKFLSGQLVRVAPMKRRGQASVLSI